MTIFNTDYDMIYLGPRENPKALRFWADGGILHWEDSRTNGYGTVSIREFLHRAKAINDMMANGKRSDAFEHADEIERLMRFVEGAIWLAKKAKEQGAPSDVRATRNFPVNLPSLISLFPGVDRTLTKYPIDFKP